MSEKRSYTKITTPIGVFDSINLDFKTIKEEWNVYELDDKTRVRVRFNVAKILQAVDKSGKTPLNPNGEPIISINGNLTIALDVPKEESKK
jgi:hypothetical protein